MNKLFITGRPRCGKSTIIRNRIAPLGFDLGGFSIQRLTRKGETWAFRLLDLADEPYVTHLESNKLFDDIAIFMATPGKWQGAAAVFNSKGCRALEKCLGKEELVIMDELGIFERDALEFQASVFKILDSRLPVLGVLKNKSNPFLDRVRSHPAVSIWEYPGPQAEEKLTDFLRRRVYGEVDH